MTMQITIDIPETLARDLKKIYKQKDQQKKLINEAVKEKIQHIKKTKKDPFIKWLLNPTKDLSSGLTDISVNHDKYLYGAY